MPVPVPVYSKPPAHPVIKNSRSHPLDTDYSRHSVFKHLSDSLPLPPSGPPPAFATREEWISSLPSWRRNKPRRIWEDDTRSYGEHDRQGFEQGLAIAGNAAAIKGEPAQASIPPVAALISAAGLDAPMSAYGSSEEEEDACEMDGIMGWQGEDVAHLTDEDEDMAADCGSDSDSLNYASACKDYVYQQDGYGQHHVDYAHYDERANFSPCLEETSPENDRDSSPIGPATPFAEYVDRAVADAPGVTGGHIPSEPVQYCTDDFCAAECYECQQRYHPVPQVAQHAAPAPEPVVTPSASTAYRRLAEPLSEWVANFVWKACTTGFNLPAPYAEPSAFVKSYPSQPPEHLARSTHSVLLATLLQPSAVYLALWYIVRLPIFFGPVGLGPDHIKEMRFRAELLGDAHVAYDREKFELSAPFRLIVLGCMLANKWLDDHTFSNKTWHTISNIDVRSLNMLESLALDLLRHDLSIPPTTWAAWLRQLHGHHLSLTSPSFPQPISRPSSSPYNIVRKALESLIDATEICQTQRLNGTPEPVFYDFDDQKKELSEREQACADVDVLEFDLDEDGPLREEYLPRRRISGAARPARGQENIADKVLPPPAKWSPAADEPLIPPPSRPQYVAPQPIARVHVSAQPLAPPPAPFQQALDMTRRIWPGDEQVTRYVPPPVAVPMYAAPYHGYEYSYPPPPSTHSHTRSQSLSFHAPVAQAPCHYRSYSQTRFDGALGEYPYAEYQQYAPRPVVLQHWPARFNCVASYAPVYESAPGYHHQRPLVKV